MAKKIENLSALCAMCRTHPPRFAKIHCADCEYDILLSLKIKQQAQDQIRAARLARIPRTNQKLCAAPTPIARERRPYEVSYVTSEGLRVAEPFWFDWEAWSRFHKMKERNICGLRMSFNDGEKRREIDYHNGTVRPHVKMKG